MADITAVIETLEHGWMRAWVAGDVKAMRALTSRDFILLVGSRPARLLDYRSWLDAAMERWLCSSYRFGDVHVRRFGAVALFASQLELQASMDGHDWSGRMWVSDLWRKRRIGGWRLAERVLSRTEENGEVAAGVKALQLWR